MKKLLIEKIVRKELRRALSENAAVEMHRTMDGAMVPFGCDTCVEDIGNRIQDATYERDTCAGRTDSREHYNGILKVLRRKFRRANKVHQGGEL